MIKVTYDKVANASYIYLQEPGSKKIKKTYLCDPSEVGGMINIDFDEEGKIVGIEILDATGKVPKDVLDEAI